LKKTKALFIEDILRVLPHRHPFVLIDRIVDFVAIPGDSRAGQKVHAIKNVTFNEPFFAGHFPHRPVMPGVLIIEAMAQAGAMACYKEGAPKKDVAIGRLSEARFRRPVVPGDVLTIHAGVIKDRGQMIVIQAKSSVDDEPVTELEILASVTEI